jgi:excinuclease ABC subunit A
MTGRSRGIRIDGAAENNLRDVSLTLPPGLTAVVGVSGSGKSSLAFDTLYAEARRRHLETLSLGSPWLRTRPARVRAIDGLGPAVAVAQNVLNRNPNSTVATAAGIHPYLRVLFARFAERRCPECGTETAVTTREGQVASLRGLVAEGVPVEVLAPLVGRAAGGHGRLLAWLEATWGREAIEVDRHDRDGEALDPDEPHDIAVRVTTLALRADLASIRRVVDEVAGLGCSGLVAVAGIRRLSLTRAPLCPGCGLPFRPLEPTDFNDRDLAEAAAYRIDGCTLDELLALDIAAAAEALAGWRLAGPASRAVDQVARRLAALDAVGLGYVRLDRSSPSLSRGEAQRLRIALLLANPIEDLLHVLDEPTIGLDPGQMSGILAQVAKLRGPVVMVEHDRWAVAAADHVVELGPGPGDAGGRVMFEGTPAGLWAAATPSGRWFSRRERADGARPGAGPPERGGPRIRVEDAAANNLRGIDVEIPLGRLTVVAGPSGAGKTTLVRDVLLGSLDAGEPVGCAMVDAPPLRAVAVTQEPIGRNARSSAATYTGLADQIRSVFAAATGEAPGRFSFNRPEGACPECEGIGAVELKLPYVPSEWIACEACGGRRFRPETLATDVALADGVRRSVADVYDLSVDEAAAVLGDGPAGRIMAALRSVGLGYLRLGQGSPSLSGGEAQRIKLAKQLSGARPGDLVVLDEPTTGLHPADVSALIAALRELVDAGSTVVVVEHQPDLVAAADWLIRLGPGGGPEGGRLVFEGAPGDDRTPEPPARPRAAPRRRPRASPQIRIDRATANNLRGVSVRIAKNAITAVIGVSGSGKSSLVRDVLEAEATRRFVESLSMYERQSIREGPDAPAGRIEGLGPTIAIRADGRVREPLSTVGTATELGFHIGVLLAFAGTRICPACGGDQRRVPGAAGRPWRCDRCGSEGPPAEPHLFSPSTYAAACLECHGVGTIGEPQVDRLIVHPELPVAAGAMYSPGYFPTSYYAKAPSLGREMAIVLGRRYGFDPFETPFDDMSDAAKDVFLWGDEDLEIPAAKGKTGTRMLRWHGVLRIVRGWDIGGLYVDHRTCPSCGGGRLRDEYLDVRLGAMNRGDLHRRAVWDVAAVVDGVELPDGAPHWAAQSLSVARRRLRFLERVGLGHLHLDRLARTLSAGEAQRVKLASLLGAELTGVTVLLDEPSRGLHPREVGALGDTLAELRDIGNTVVVVDHDPLLVGRADRLVVLGPGAGVDGGRLLASGPAARVRRASDSAVQAIVGRPRSGGGTPPVRTRRRPSGELVIRRPTENNLSGEDVAIPLGVVTGLCGVSGSGKSTLAIDILARALAPARISTSVAYDDIRPGAHDGIDGAPDRVVVSDQSRSGIQTPGAFLGVLEPLRRAYAESGEAASRGLGAGALTPDCDACHGRGSVREDMGFMPSLRRTCEACDGTGYRADVRELVVRGHSLPELSLLPLAAIADLWGDVDRIGRPLGVASSLGLGYLRLGQPSHSLSGGEAQRLRLCRELAKSTRAPTLYILDEPTLGLHASDVARLEAVLDGLVERGHSVLVVEHDPSLLAWCDAIVELGPGGGPDGGRVVATGTPEQVARLDTPTAPYLREALS